MANEEEQNYDVVFTDNLLNKITIALTKDETALKTIGKMVNGTAEISRILNDIVIEIEEADVILKKIKKSGSVIDFTSNMLDKLKAAILDVESADIKLSSEIIAAINTTKETNYSNIVETFKKVGKNESDIAKDFLSAVITCYSQNFENKISTKISDAQKLTGGYNDDYIMKLRRSLTVHLNEEQITELRNEEQTLQDEYNSKLESNEQSIFSESDLKSQLEDESLKIKRLLDNSSNITIEELKSEFLNHKKLYLNLSLPVDKLSMQSAYRFMVPFNSFVHTLDGTLTRKQTTYDVERTLKKTHALSSLLESEKNTEAHNLIQELKNKLQYINDKHEVFSNSMHPNDLAVTLDEMYNKATSAFIQGVDDNIINNINPPEKPVLMNLILRVFRAIVIWRLKTEDEINLETEYKTSKEVIQELSELKQKFDKNQSPGHQESTESQSTEHVEQQMSEKNKSQSTEHVEQQMSEKIESNASPTRDSTTKIFKSIVSINPHSEMTHNEMISYSPDTVTKGVGVEETTTPDHLNGKAANKIDGNSETNESSAESQQRESATGGPTP